jgi:hypothetical protein
MKTTIFKLFMLLTGIILLSISCKNDEGSNDNLDNQVITNNGNITVKGSGNYEFTIEVDAAAYLITFKEKAQGNLDNVEIDIPIMGGWVDWMPWSIMALRSSSWYEGATIQSYSKKQTLKFNATATGAFEVTFEKLPLSKAAVNTPQTFTGAGSTFFGPVTISNNGTLTITCSDACQAGFTVNIVDATNGNMLVNTDNTALYSNYDMATSKLTNNISVVKTKTGLSGNYFIWVSANMNANYTVQVQ